MGENKTGRLIVRRAEEKDIPQVMELLSQVLEVHAAIRPDLFISGTTKYTPRQLKEIFNDPKTPVFVAVDENGNIPGYCFCIMEHYPASNNSPKIDTLYIDDLCLDENARGSGTAKLLYDHVLDFAKEQSCYNVTLNVWEGNGRAKGFYEKMGMKPRKTMMEKIL